MDINQRIELIDRLATVNGSTFISIDTEVVPLMNSTLPSNVPGAPRQPNPQYGRVVKRSKGNVVMVFQNKRVHGYKNMVDRRLVKEGKRPEQFQLSPRRWGTRIPNMPLVVHNNEYYLEVIFLKPGVVKYFLDGRPISLDRVMGLRDQQPPHQGGLNDKVILRVFSFDSLRRIKIGRETMTFP